MEKVHVVLKITELFIRDRKPYGYFKVTSFIIFYLNRTNLELHSSHLIVRKTLKPETIPENWAYVTKCGFHYVCQL